MTGRMRRVINRVALAAGSLRYADIAWKLLLAAFAGLALIAAVLSAPFDFGWPASVQWLARSLVAAGVLIGVLGSVTGESALSVARRVRTWLQARTRRVQATAAWFSLMLLLVVVVGIPVALLWRTDPVTKPVVLQTAVEMGLGDTVTPWRLDQDSSGAVWFHHDHGFDEPDELGRVSKDQASISVRLPAESDDTPSIKDFVTVGTDVWVVVDGLQSRIAVFDSSGQPKSVRPITGAKAIEVDARGHVWVAAVTGIDRKRASLWEIDPVAGSQLRHDLPATADVENLQFHFDPAGTVAWVVTTPPKDAKRFDIWTVRDGIVRPFAIQRPKLRFDQLGASTFTVDRQGTIWITAGFDLVTFSPLGLPRILHLSGAQYIEDLVPAPDSGVIALVPTDGVLADDSVSPLRSYLVHIPTADSPAFPSYFRLPEPLWIEEVAKGRPAVIVGNESDIILSVPGRHSIFRFPLGVLDPPAQDCGDAARVVDRATRGASLPPLTRADLEAPDETPLTPAFWKSRLTRDVQRAARTSSGLDGLPAGLPVGSDSAVENLREVLRLQQAAIKARLTKPDTLNAENYIASFRMQLIGDVVIAANGLRELCGLPRLDFDSNDVWGAARSPTVQ